MKVSLFFFITNFIYFDCLNKRADDDDGGGSS